MMTNEKGTTFKLFISFKSTIDSQGRQFFSETFFVEIFFTSWNKSNALTQKFNRSGMCGYCRTLIKMVYWIKSLAGLCLRLLPVHLLWMKMCFGGSCFGRRLERFLFFSWIVSKSLASSPTLPPPVLRQAWLKLKVLLHFEVWFMISRGWFLVVLVTLWNHNHQTHMSIKMYNVRSEISLHLSNLYSTKISCPAYHKSGHNFC